jgi:hypothetical protein
MKSIGEFLKRLRTKKEAADSSRESIERGRREAEIVARAEWSKATLALAERLGDVELIKKLAGSALAADAELHEMNRMNAEELTRIKALIEKAQGEN